MLKPFRVILRCGATMYTIVDRNGAGYFGAVDNEAQPMIQTADPRDHDLSLAQIDERISFHEDDQIMEVSFENLHMATQREANAFYDRIEDRIAQTGHDKWFFLVNYSNSRIDPMAWISFARRGKTLNLSHSQGSVRFDASDETRAQIERDAGTENFDPNLFADRDSAVARLRSLPSQRRVRVSHDPNYSVSDFVRRISFDQERGIMEADFSHFTFWHSTDVDMFYDFIEERIRETDRKWYFLVNLNGCQIMPEAWVAYARRGKNLNIAASLGSVRFAAGSETETEIRQRAQSQDFRPNIRNTREEALARIEEIRAERG
jgi:hypothetical protein